MNRDEATIQRLAAARPKPREILGHEYLGPGSIHANYAEPSGLRRELAAAHETIRRLRAEIKELKR